MNTVRKTVYTAGVAVLLGLILAGCDSSVGNYNPPNTPPANTDALAGKLLILQAYGTGPDGGETVGGAVSNSFVELYNTTNAAINLSGYSLQYANGTSEL